MSAEKKPGRGETLLMLPPVDLVVIGVDTPHQRGQHVLWDMRAFLPLEEALVESIREHGVQKPVFVRQGEEGRWEVVDGRRRVMHAREANRRRLSDGEPPVEVRCLPKRGSEAHLYGVSRLANRGHLEEDPLQTALAAARLVEQGHSRSVVAAYLTCSTSMLAIYLGLLQLHPTIQADVSAGVVSLTAAAKLASLPQDKQLAAYESMKAGGKLTVADAAAARNKQRGAAARAPLSIVEAPPSRRAIRRMLERPDPGLAHLGQDFWLGVQWVMGLQPTSRIKGMAAAIARASRSRRAHRD